MVLLNFTSPPKRKESRGMTDWASYSFRISTPQSSTKIGTTLLHMVSSLLSLI